MMLICGDLGTRTTAGSRTVWLTGHISRGSCAPKAAILAYNLITRWILYLKKAGGTPCENQDKWPPHPPIPPSHLALSVHTKPAWQQPYVINTRYLRSVLSCAIRGSAHPTDPSSYFKMPTL